MTYKLKNLINNNLSLHLGNNNFLEIPKGGNFVLEIENNKAPVELKVILFKYFNGEGFTDSDLLLRSFFKSLKPALDKYLKKDDWKVYGEPAEGLKVEEHKEEEQPKKRRRKSEN